MATEVKIAPFINVIFTITQVFTIEHMGIDFATGDNHNLYSIFDGVVTENISSDTSYGNRIRVKENETGREFLYAHMKEPSPLLIGQAVSKGQFVGIEGTTGNSTGIHLHLEIRDNNRNLLNPADICRYTKCKGFARVI